MLRFKVLLGISLIFAFIFVNALAAFLNKDKQIVSSSQIETPYGKIYLENN